MRMRREVNLLEKKKQVQEKVSQRQRNRNGVMERNRELIPDTS